MPETLSSPNAEVLTPGEASRLMQRIKVGCRVVVIDEDGTQHTARVTSADLTLGECRMEDQRTANVHNIIAVSR